MRRSLARLTVPLLLLALIAGCASAPKPAENPPVPEGPVPPPTQQTQVACDNSAYAPISAPPGNPHKPPQGSAERPAVVSANVDFTEAFEGGGQLLGARHVVRSGAVVVGTERFLFHAQLQPAPLAAWYRENISVTGAVPQPLRDDLVASGTVEVDLPAGKAGEKITLTLKGVTLPEGGEGDLTLTFCRKEEPRVALSYRDGDAWKPVSPEQSIRAAGELTLRVGFTQPMDRPSTEAALLQLQNKVPLENPPALSWADDQTVLLTYVQAPPVVRLAVSGARSTDGLFTLGGVPVVHTGEPARLVAVDPVKGAEQPVAELMPEITSGAVSGDGRKLWITALRLSTVASMRDVWWEVDLVSGERKEIPPVRGGVGWAAAGLDPSLAEKILRGVYSLSPDGQQMAVLAAQQVPYPEDYLIPHDLMVYDSRGQVVNAFPGAARIYSPPKDGWYRRSLPAWHPESRQVAFLRDGKGGAASLMVADLKAGTVRTLVEQVEGLHYGSTYPLTWSPDGKWLVAGSRVLDASTGRLHRQLPGTERPTVVRWSPDGQWLLTQADEWGEVAAYQLSTGQTFSLGKGMVLGWTPAGQALIVRWKGAEHRIIFGI